MSKYVNWKAKIQTLVLDIVIWYSFNLHNVNDTVELSIEISDRKSVSRTVSKTQKICATS